MPIQISFSIRVSSSVKSVQLIGSWDSYVRQLPLSCDKTSSKPGAWKATFRFSSSQLVSGGHYWYYYILDGYHCAHNPGLPSTIEPTTGRELNILEIPVDESRKPSSSSSSSSKKESSSSKHSTSKHSSSSHHSQHSSSSKHSSSKHSSKTPSLSLEIPRGRPLSISEIKAPKPLSPSQTKALRTLADGEIDDLVSRFAQTGLPDDDEYVHYIPVEPHQDGRLSPLSPVSSSDDESASASDGDSGCFTPISDYSDSGSCECVGITRSGQRVRMDCGGAVCGYGYDSDSSTPDARQHSSRRYGVVVL